MIAMEGDGYDMGEPDKDIEQRLVPVQVQWTQEFVWQGTRRLSSLRTQGALILGFAATVLALTLGLGRAGWYSEVIGAFFMLLSALAAAEGLRRLQDLEELPPTKLLVVEPGDLKSMQEHARLIKDTVVHQRGIMRASQPLFLAALLLLAAGLFVLWCGHLASACALHRFR